jgi:purine nucleoside phosphorylase
MDQLRSLLHTRFHRDTVDVAWIGGSATWAAPVPECLGVPAGNIMRLTGGDTPWGPLGRYRLVDVDGQPLLRIPVHGWLGADGSFQPSPQASMRVFYLLRELGVRLVLIDASVGGISVPPGGVLVTSDFVDQHDKPFAHEFARTLGLVPWMRMGEPYCAQIRARLIAAARNLFAQGPGAYAPLGRDGATPPLHTEGVYATTPFGVFETTAEIQQYKREGWAVVGQSAGIETMLARLCGMHVAHIAVSANWAEGLDQGHWNDDMAAFYWACTQPMARIGWEVVRGLLREGIAAGGCACEAILRSTDLTGLPVPEA